MAYGSQHTCWFSQRIYSICAFILILVAIPSVFTYSGSQLNIEQGDTGPFKREGSNVTLKCTIVDNALQEHASEIQFFERALDGNNPLPIDTFRVVHNRTAEITIINLQRGKHHYTCKLPEQQFHFGGNIYTYVGVTPVTPVVECFNSNTDSFWCQFEPGEYSGPLKNNFTLEYKQRMDNEFGPWKECLDYETKGPQTCYVEPDENPGYQLEIRVRESNHFGVSPYQMLIYNTREMVKPLPPSSFKVNEVSSYYLNLAWQEPLEWQHSYVLEYQIRYTDLSEPDAPHEVSKESQATDITYKLGNLTPFTEYMVDIRCRWKSLELSNIRWSEWNTLKVNTSEGAPGGEVQNLQFLEQTSTQNTFLRDIYITWQDVPEEMQHGKILGYNIYYESKDGHLSLKTTEKSYKLEGFLRFMRYTVKVNAYTSVGEGPNSTLNLTHQSAVLSPPLFKDPKRVNPTLTELQWEKPIQEYQEELYYQVRYRPVVEKGDRAVAWLHAVQTQELEAKVRVNCSLVRGGSDFEFELSALSNKGQSKAVNKELYMCEDVDVITIVASVLAVCFCVTLLLCCILWVKHSDITKPAPEPYFIDAVLRPMDSSKFQWKENKNSPKHEKESFDTLRSADSYTELLAPVIERMSSKDSSSASTDQGIHDMDIDSVDLKNGLPQTNQNNFRRCNRYSSGMGQSIVSDCPQQCPRSNSNPGMEVLSEDYEDAVFEEIPQDIDEGSSMCLSHTYARSAFNHSPPLTPNDDIGSSSSLLSNGSSGPNSLPPYSQMACNNHSRLSSTGSDSSGVDYHTMGSQGLAPMKPGKDTTEVGSLTYSKLSQIPTSPSPPPDVVVDLDHATASDEDIPAYNQIGLRNPVDSNGNDSRDSIQSTRQANKSPSHFDNNNLPIKGLIQPQKEIIVATALMPSYPQHQRREQNKPEDQKPCTKEPVMDQKAESSEDVRIPMDDHSYSVVGANPNTHTPNGSPPNPPTSARPKPPCDNSAYVPNNCMNGFSIPNGIPSKSVPIPSPPCNEGYVPNNSPPTAFGGIFPVAQSPRRGNQGKMEGYAPATPQAMAAIVGGKPLTSEAYVPNTVMA